MKTASREWKSAVVAIAIGLVFPYAWIVGTSEGRTSKEHTIERSVADRITPAEYEEFMKEYSRPMTFVEKLGSSAHIAREQWMG